MSDEDFPELRQEEYSAHVVRDLCAVLEDHGFSPRKGSAVLLQVGAVLAVVSGQKEDSTLNTFAANLRSTHAEGVKRVLDGIVGDAKREG